MEQSKSPKSCAYARISLLTQVSENKFQVNIQFLRSISKKQETQLATSMSKFWISSIHSKENTFET